MSSTSSPKEGAKTNASCLAGARLSDTVRDAPVHLLEIIRGDGDALAIAKFLARFLDLSASLGVCGIVENPAWRIVHGHDGRKVGLMSRRCFHSARIHGWRARQCPGPCVIGIEKSAGMPRRLVSVALAIQPPGLLPSLTRNICGSWAKVNAEIEKCDLVCSKLPPAYALSNGFLPKTCQRYIKKSAKCMISRA